MQVFVTVQKVSLRRGFFYVIISSMNILIIPKKEIRQEVKTLITRAVQEVLYDPDFGLELSEDAKRRLRKAKTQPLRQKTVPFSEIKKRYL